MTSDLQREKKYQILRLYNSGQITLKDIKAAFRITAGVATEEYSNPADLQAVGETMSRVEKLEKLAKTRSQARQEFILRLKPKPRMLRNREEHIAKFATGFRGGLPHNWTRYGLLRAKGNRKAKPRPGSSKGKIGKTVYKGFKRFNRNFDEFEKSLLALVKSRPANKKFGEAISRVRGGINVSVAKR